MDVVKFVKEEEGFREKPYYDTLGVATFGIGFTYITEDEADTILKQRIEQIEERLEKDYDWYNDLSETRKAVMISMVYQLGHRGVEMFRKFLAAMAKGDYAKASVEMLDSLWARQTPHRAKRQAKMIKNG